MAIGLARIGSPSQKIVVAPLATLREVDFGTPLHSLVIIANNVHYMEGKMLIHYGIDKEQVKKILEDKYRYK